jgi:hypothetical protein
VFSHGFLKHKTKIIFLHFGFYNGISLDFYLNKFSLIKHIFQKICIGSPWHFVDIFKGMIHIGQEFLLLDFEPKSIHHSKHILGKLIKRTPTP